LATYKKVKNTINQFCRVSEAEAKEVLIDDFMSVDERERFDVDEDYDGPERVYKYDSLLGLHCIYRYSTNVPTWRPAAVSIHVFVVYIFYVVVLILLLTILSCNS
jgi:hypothetical protein